MIAGTIYCGDKSLLCLIMGLLVILALSYPVLAQEETGDDQATAAAQARIVITSDPTGQVVLLDGRELETVTPVVLDLDPGEYQLMVNAEGFQPLVFDLSASAGQQTGLGFILLTTPPEPPLPEDLGLQYMANELLLNEKGAEATKNKFHSMSEFFVVFPLAQGIFGKIAFDDDSSYPADALIISGVVLVAGTYFLGKVFYARKLEEIRTVNAGRTDANYQAKAHNRTVDAAISEQHAVAVILWEQDSEGRGEVFVVENR